MPNFDENNMVRCHDPGFEPDQATNESEINRTQLRVVSAGPASTPSTPSTPSTHQPSVLEYEWQTEAGLDKNFEASVES